MPSATKVQLGYVEAINPFSLANGTASAPAITFTSSTATGMFSPSTGALAFSTGSTQNALTILSNGNVGIGLTNPSLRFHIREDSSTYEKIFLENQLAGQGVNIRFKHANSPTYGYDIGATAGADAISIRRNAAEQVRIDASGNFGIGTTNPSQKLHVVGAGYFTDYVGVGNVSASIPFYVNLTSADDYNPNLMVQDPGAYDSSLTINTTNIVSRKLNAVLEFVGTDGPVSVHGRHAFIGAESTGGTYGSKMVFKVRSGAPYKYRDLSDLVTILGSGNVGIGTTNPTEELQIYNTVFPTFSAVAGGDKELRMQFHTGDSTANLVSIGNYPLVLQTNSLERLRILGNGNVGIATTNPQALFHAYSANGTGSVTGATVGIIGNRLGFGNSTNNVYGALNFGDWSANGQESIVSISSKQVGTSGQRYGDNGGEIAALRFVGTGTDSSTGIVSAEIASTCNASTSYGNSATDSADLSFKLSGSGGTRNGAVERMRLTGAGNLGVGSTSPNAKVDIWGNSNTDFSQIATLRVHNQANAPTLATIDNQSTTNYFSFQLTGLNAGDTHLRSYWGVSVDLNDGNLGDSLNATQSRITSTSSFTVNRRNSTTGFLNLFTIRNSGNVGIGTTNPAEMLQIFKSGGDNYIRIDAGGTNGGKCGIKLVEQNILYGWEITHDSATDKLDILHNSNSGTYSPSSKVTFLPTGLVGIGTTAPSQLLHLVGNLRVDQNTTDSTGTVTNGIFPLGNITLVNNASANINLGSRFTGIVFVNGVTNDHAAAIFHISSASAYDNDNITRLTFVSHAAANTTDLTMSSRGLGVDPQYQLTQTGTATKTYRVFAIGIYG